MEDSTRTYSLSDMTQRMSRNPSPGPSFGEILESFRRRRGLKRRHIARQLGIPQGQVKDWERGVEIPYHPEILRSLEVLMEIPEGLLARAAGFSAPAPQEKPKMTVRQGLASLAVPEQGPAVHPLDVQPVEALEARLESGPVSSGEVAPGVVSYRYNPPEERWVYRIRFLLTAAGMALLGLLLIWSVARVWEELGNVWNAVFGS